MFHSILSYILLCCPFYFLSNKIITDTDCPEHTNRTSTEYSSSTANLILDTDIGNDIDDVLALCMLYNYHKEDKINLIGITINKANCKTIPFVDLLNHWYGYNDLPVGFIGNNGPTPEEGSYLNNTLKAKKPDGVLFPRNRKGKDSVPEAWKLQRKLLAAQPDHSVKIVSVGFLSNLSKLLKSEADEYSDLSGMELVKRKVQLLSIMGGDFSNPDNAEYNIVNDIASAKYIFEYWPSPIIAGGFEIGANVKFPATAIEKYFDKQHPVRISYESFSKMPYDRPCWDLISALIAVEGEAAGLGFSPSGNIKVDSKGRTSFQEKSTGKHRFLILKKDHKTDLINQLIKAVIGNDCSSENK